MKKDLKLYLLVGVLALSFILFILFLTKSKNYIKEYQIKDIIVNESYNKENTTYSFIFKYQDKSLEYVIPSKYKQARGLIKDINVISNENTFCLVPISEQISTTPVCYQNDQQIHYSLVDILPAEYKQPEESKKLTFEEIDIYNTDFSYLIWNYQNGFYYINDKVTTKINLFNKESYQISLVGYTEDYLIIADYDSNYTFNKIYIIDFKNGNKKSYELDYNIYFDSYFLGYEDNKAYLVDNKESVMYEINAKNGKIDKIQSKVLVNGKWENKDIKSLVNNNVHFTYATPYNYEVIDNNLYLKYQDHNNKILIANNITSVVRIKNDQVFYIKDKDTLYMFNPQDGEVKLAYYYGWYFYSNNMIYLN